MKRFLVIAEILMACVVLHGQTTQYQRIAGYCEQGGYTIEVGAGVSTTYVQQSFPNCTVTVYYHGTTTLATIYSDNNGDTQANPFTASNDGSWFFYGPNARYDVRFSGNGITTPFTRSDIFPGPNPKPLGGIAVQQIAAPGVPIVTVFGATGSTAWAYKCTALDVSGETTGSTATTISNGNAILSILNYNAVSCPVVVGAVSYNIYRTTAGGTPSSTGLIGNVQQGQNLNDTGAAASTAIPTVNTTGQISGIGKLPDIGAQVFNVKAYGAKGDGIADDTAAVNGAIAAAQVGGGIVFFPAGTYKVGIIGQLNPTGVKSMVSLACASPTASTIKFTGSSGIILAQEDLYPPYYAGYVEHCNFDMSGASNGAAALQLVDSGGWTISNNTFVGNSGNAIGILLEDKTQWCERNKIVFNMFSELNPGIAEVVDAGDSFNSFAYNIIAFDHFQVPFNAAGMSIQNNASAYSNFWSMRANFDSPPGYLVHLINTASVTNTNMDLQAEGGSGTYLVCPDNGTTWADNFGMLRANPNTALNCTGENFGFTGKVNGSFMAEGALNVSSVIPTSGVGATGPSWSGGSSAPSGSCTNGSLYSNTSGTSGSTLYACVGSAWVDVK